MLCVTAHAVPAQMQDDDYGDEKEGAETERFDPRRHRSPGSVVVSWFGTASGSCHPTFLGYNLSTSSHGVSQNPRATVPPVPKLWNQTIDSHRRAVRDAILDTTARLVEKLGLRAVTMSEIAKGSGIGRATLYKYFASVEDMLVAWHERQVGAHFARLIEVANGPGRADKRLRTVLQAYAGMNHDQLGTELSLLLHQGNHVARTRQHLDELLRDLLEQGIKARIFRNDVPPAELATYCLHALAAAASTPSPKAVGRLIDVILSGLTGGTAHRPRRGANLKERHRT
jgi:AcrR family transcriptional regulator